MIQLAATHVRNSRDRLAVLASRPMGVSCLWLRHRLVSLFDVILSERLIDQVQCNRSRVIIELAYCVAVRPV